MMKSIKALLIMVSILLAAGHSNARFLKKNNLFIETGHSNARFLKKNNLFIEPYRLWVVDPTLKSLVDDDTSLQTAHGHMEKDALGCVQEIPNSRSGWSSESATNKKLLSFRLNPSVQKTDKTESSPSWNKSQGTNYIGTEQRLSTSSNSPGVRRHYSQSRNVNIMKSHHSNADDQLQQKKSNTRKLGSTPSPGGGH